MIMVSGTSHLPQNPIAALVIHLVLPQAERVEQSPPKQASSCRGRPRLYVGLCQNMATPRKPRQKSFRLHSLEGVIYGLYRGALKGLLKGNLGI